MVEHSAARRGCLEQEMIAPGQEMISPVPYGQVSPAYIRLPFSEDPSKHICSGGEVVLGDVVVLCNNTHRVNTYVREGITHPYRAIN